MKFLYVVIIAVSLAAPLRSEEARLLRFPDIANDGRIVFTYEDDLWILPSNATKAFRLTSHPGREAQAKFSPDGKWIAYIGNYDGNSDVYVLPSSGGEPKRLTFNPSWTTLCDWSGDGKFIYLITPKRYRYELYRIPSTGGAAERIPIGRAWEATVSDDGKIVYTPNSATRMSWRGYRGGLQPDLFLTDTKGTTFEKLTSWEGYDAKPLFFKSNLLYLSDREDNRMNLYQYDFPTKTSKRLTLNKDWDVEEPSVSQTDIVFISEGYLWKMDGLNNKISKLTVELTSDHWLTRPFTSIPDLLVNDVVPGIAGKKTVVETRGEIFLFDQSSTNPANLTMTSGSREILPALSPDGSKIAFYSDRSGEYELYVMNAQEGSQWEQITNGNKTFYYHIVWSPDGKRLLFGDKEYQIYWADVATKKVTKVDKGEHQRDNEIYWEFSDYDWSADGKWIAYAKCNFNMNSSIYLFNTETRKSTRLTDDRYDNLSPAFDRNGKYLYFISYRDFEPELDPFMDNNLVPHASRIMVAQLQEGLPAPFTAEEKVISIDVLKRGIEIQDIQKRIFTLSIESGNYYKLTATNGRLFFLSKPRWGFPGDEVYAPKSVTPYTLETVSIEDMQKKKIISGIAITYHVSSDGNFVGYISNIGKGVVSTSKEAVAGTGKLQWGNVKLRVEPRAEFSQIFNDVLSQINNFFYDPSIHGLDLSAIAKKYQALLPYCVTRQDVNYLLGKLNAEVGTSHMYVFRTGEAPRVKYERSNVGLLGADLVPDGKYYRFDHLIETPNDDPDTHNPLLARDVKLREGHYLIAIDGSSISTDEDYGKYLVGKAGQNITLTVNDKPSASNAWTITIEALSEEYGMRYKEMVEANYRKVKEATDDRVGYMHLSDMDKDGLTQFEQAFRAERFRDGLIIDVRDNGGGFVSWFIIDKLERILTGLTKTRAFAPMLYPHGIVRGPMVLLCNEGSGSDGDLVTWQFKERKFGPVIGTRTWGGLIGIINFQDLIDGGMVTQVNVGFSDLKGNWIVENHGVDPDIVIENNPADIERGIDAQLNKAIEVVQKLLKEKPLQNEKAPVFPKRY